MSENIPDEGYDEWLDAVADGSGYYLSCANGHGSLPPRRVCPHCASREFAREPLPETGEIEAFTVVHVATPQFAADTPYATAVADFDGVRLTGQLRGTRPEDVSDGMTVEAGVAESETTGERLLVFRPR